MRVFRFVLLTAALLPCLGVDCTNFTLLLPVTPDGEVTITAIRTGCSEISRSVAFTAVGGRLDQVFQWFFPDGRTDSGAKVVHTFDAAGSVEVSLVTNNKTYRTRISVPLQGDSDGGPDPYGDRCVPNEGEEHIPQGSDWTYISNPPASGPHYDLPGIAPVTPGFYKVPLKPERWVHNLEHGGIVVLYDCDGDCPESLLNDLQGFFDAAPLSKSNEKKIVIAPYDGLPVPIMAIAWDVQRDYTGFDMNGLLDFYRIRVDRGPEDVP